MSVNTLIQRQLFSITLKYHRQKARLPPDRYSIMPITTAIHPLTPLNKAIESSEFYEAAISVDETVVSNYWYLGLSYLLTGREEDAQAAWFIPFSSASEAETDIYTKELLAILDREAKARSEVSELDDAWLLRQHLQTIEPENIENILQLVILADSLVDHWSAFGNRRH